MSFQIHFRNCKGVTAGMQTQAGESHNKFATYADMLLLGKDVGVDVPGSNPDTDHIVEVSLVSVSPTNPRDLLTVAACFLVCGCEAAVTPDKGTSKLLVPEKKIHVPGRT